MTARFWRELIREIYKIGARTPADHRGRRRLRRPLAITLLLGYRSLQTCSAGGKIGTAVG